MIKHFLCLIAFYVCFTNSVGNSQWHAVDIFQTYWLVAIFILWCHRCCCLNDSLFSQNALLWGWSHCGWRTHSCKHRPTSEGGWDLTGAGSISRWDWTEILTLMHELWWKAFLWFNPQMTKAINGSFFFVSFAPRNPHITVASNCWAQFGILYELNWHLIHSIVKTTNHYW